MGDMILFRQVVYEKMISKTSSLPPLGERIIAGRVVKESLGSSKNTHTFTIEVLWSSGVSCLPPLYPLVIYRHNLYPLKIYRQLRPCEEDSVRALQARARDSEKDTLLAAARKTGHSFHMDNLNSSILENHVMNGNVDGMVQTPDSGKCENLSVTHNLGHSSHYQHWHDSEHAIDLEGEKKLGCQSVDQNPDHQPEKPQLDGEVKVHRQDFKCVHTSVSTCDMVQTCPSRKHASPAVFQGTLDGDGKACTSMENLSSKKTTVAWSNDIGNMEKPSHDCRENQSLTVNLSAMHGDHSSSRIKKLQQHCNSQKLIASPSKLKAAISEAERLDKDDRKKRHKERTGFTQPLIESEQYNSQDIQEAVPELCCRSGDGTDGVKEKCKQHCNICTDSSLPLRMMHSLPENGDNLNGRKKKKNKKSHKNQGTVSLPQAMESKLSREAQGKHEDSSGLSENQGDHVRRSTKKCEEFCSFIAQIVPNSLLERNHGLLEVSGSLDDSLKKKKRKKNQKDHRNVFASEAANEKPSIDFQNIQENNSARPDESRIHIRSTREKYEQCLGIHLIPDARLTMKHRVFEGSDDLTGDWNKKRQNISHKNQWDMAGNYCGKVESVHETIVPTYNKMQDHSGGLVVDKGRGQKENLHLFERKEQKRHKNDQNIKGGGSYMDHVQRKEHSNWKLKKMSKRKMRQNQWQIQKRIQQHEQVHQSDMKEQPLPYYRNQNREERAVSSLTTSKESRVKCYILDCPQFAAQGCVNRLCRSCCQAIGGSCSRHKATPCPHKLN
eukprot:Gb_20322 [translate_table: standard]